MQVRDFAASRELRAAPEGNRLTAAALGVIRGRGGPVLGIVRFLLAVLAVVYSAGLDVYLLLYRLGIRRKKMLPCPVVSIGNLTSGGTGKTPMTETVCRLCLDIGMHPAIVSRGYRGSRSAVPAVVSDGVRMRLSARQAGDEPVVLAQALPGVPVVVGRDRRASGALAVGQFAPDLVVLDDGMQYWQLHRDLEIVLVNCVCPFDNGWTLPRGLLREPPRHLRRSSIIVVTNAERAGSEILEQVVRRVRKLAPGRPVFTANLRPVGLRDIRTGDWIPVAWLGDRPIAAVCAVGDPGAFEETLVRAGAQVVYSRRLMDHARISDAELASVEQQALAKSADAIVVTEKDAVKLSESERRLPVMALTVRMQLDHESEFVDLLAAIAPGSAQEVAH